MDDGNILRQSLQKHLKVRHFFALGFGAIVGVGWLIMLGNWLRVAGPVGAALGFALASLVMVAIALCYAELATVMPEAGGEAAYARHIFGRGAEFWLGWFLAMGYVAIASFEAISVGWVLSALFQRFDKRALVSLNQSATLGDLACAAAGTAVFTWLNYRNARYAAGTQNVLVYSLAAIAPVLLAVALWKGSTSNLDPLVAATPDGAWWPGVLSIAMTAPFWFGGFNMIPQLLEEAAPGESVPLVGRVIILSIVSALAFYVIVILASAMLVPWPTLLEESLPAAAAFETAFSSAVLSRLVLVAALLGLLTTWNAYMMAASRLLFALGRQRLLPAIFGHTHGAYDTPAAAVLFVGVVSLLGAMLGRQGLEPIVNAVSVSLGLAYVATCAGAYRLRRRSADRQSLYKAPGGRATIAVGLVGSLLFLAMAVYSPYRAGDGRIPLEWWILAVWTLAALPMWLHFRRSAS